MQMLDWCIVLGLLAFMTWAAYSTKRYTRSVADFLAANRCAGKYLVTVSQGIAGLGAITVIANFEMYYKAGFTANWWQLIWLAVVASMNLSGWVLYRYRRTRALTMAQFFEMRYSRNFRVFAGLVAWLSGIINFGIFPSVGARFVIYFCGFPDSLLVYALVMAVLLTIAICFTFFGGQIAVIVTDFIQGAFCNIMFVVILLVVLSKFSWPQIIEALATAPEKESLVQPFRSQEAQDFNLWFYLIIAFNMFYIQGTWLGCQGYYACALNAHESRMGNILSTWRILAQNLFMLMLPICAYTFMHHSDFALQAQKVKSILVGIENLQIQKQMTTTVAMRFFMPTGIMGSLVAVMLAAFVSTHDTYLHSWGSIFIQDVIMPFRKKPLTPGRHMLLLRWSILVVAGFIFCFSLLFRQTEYIYMFFQVTGAIFTGGAGAAVIGGLYWKRGSTAAAWSGMVTGSVLAVSAVIVRQIHMSIPFTSGIMGYIASRNGAVLAFYASLIAILVYILVSLLGKRTVFNMDRLLHRDKYKAKEPSQADADKPTRGIRALVGITNEFNFRDKVIYLVTLVWVFSLVAMFIIGTAYNLVIDVRFQSWAEFWGYYVLILLILAVLSTIWLVIGGCLDLKRMFRLLGTLKRNNLDDGRVFDHHSVDE